eukprot:evm.model.scf_638.6 EVM.evm.TU.scf_638.6   scf_638:47752-50654(-)
MRRELSQLGNVLRENEELRWQKAEARKMIRSRERSYTSARVQELEATVGKLQRQLDKCDSADANRDGEMNRLRAKVAFFEKKARNRRKVFKGKLSLQADKGREDKDADDPLADVESMHVEAKAVVQAVKQTLEEAPFTF